MMTVMPANTTALPLAPGKLLINPEYIDVNRLPDRFKSWDILVAPEPTPGQPQVSQIFSPGVLGEGALGGTEPAPSRDLIGLRAHYRYSPNHLYEHTYLSSERYCWQCLEGEQRGHGDVDLASVYKIAEGRYVFTFREFKIPVASVFFLNFEDRMSTGKFLGITGDGAIANNPAGATLQRMSQTFYPDVEPV